MISVVIPLYNKEKSITKTLESVSAQNYTDWECIVVNDGSTDKSAEVVERLTINDERFLLINQENAGVSAARNRGIVEAKGEYVAFLDGDDLWDASYLDELYKLISDYPGKGIYGIGCQEIYNDEIPHVPGDYYRGPHDEWNYTNVAWTGSSATAPKDALIAVGLFDERLKYGEDKDMWYRLQLYAGGACYCKPLAYYRQDAENRAMLRVKPLEKHLVYYMEKYRKLSVKGEEVNVLSNKSFRIFFYTEMVQTLFPYMFDKQYHNEAKRLAKQIDYTGLKWSLRFRMEHPWMYRIYLKLRGKSII